MDICYPPMKIVASGNPKKKHGISFISKRLADHIFKKTLRGEWSVTQVPSLPIGNMYRFTGYFPVFTSPTTKCILFVKGRD